VPRKETRGTDQELLRIVQTLISRTEAVGSAFEDIGDD